MRIYTGRRFRTGVLCCIYMWVGALWVGGWGVWVSVCVCVQIGITPCKHLEVYREKAVKMKDTHPLSSLTYLFLQSYTHTHTHILLHLPICVSLPRPRADLLSPLWPITKAQCVIETGRKHREAEPHNDAAAHYWRAETSHRQARTTS